MDWIGRGWWVIQATKTTPYTSPIYPAISEYVYMLRNSGLSTWFGHVHRASSFPPRSLPRRHSPGARRWRRQDIYTPSTSSLDHSQLSAGNLDIVYVYASRWNVQRRLRRKKIMRYEMKSFEKLLGAPYTVSDSDPLDTHFVSQDNAEYSRTGTNHMLIIPHSTNVSHSQSHGNWTGNPINFAITPT